MNSHAKQLTIALNFFARSTTPNLKSLTGTHVHTYYLEKSIPTKKTEISALNNKSCSTLLAYYL